MLFIFRTYPLFGGLGRCQLQFLCVHGHELAKFRHIHLVAGGWYLHCSLRFVHEVEDALYNSLVSSAPEVIELEEQLEEDNLPPPSNDKEVALLKSKGRKIIAHTFSQVSTHFFTKASVQRNITSATSVVGSPTTIPSALPLILLPFLLMAAQPSHQCLTRIRLLDRIHL